MASKQDICKKIESVLPEAGKCGIDFQVEYDTKNHAWAVDLQDGNQHLRTFLEEIDAEDCLGKDRCLPLSLQISQLKHNLELYHNS
jgi:hypothetical protein